MKSPIGILWTGLVIITLCSVRAAAAEPALGVKVEVQMVAVKPLAALELIPKLQEEQSVDASVQQIQKMIAQEDAELLGWPMVMARNHTSATSETVKEVRYETELNPPMRGGGFGIERPSAEFKLYPQRLETIMVPTAFETGNVGQTLEVDASIEENGERVALSLAARCVRLVKFDEHRTRKALNGIQSVFSQPEFSRHTFTGSFTVKSGRWTLLSTSLQQQPEPRVTIFLLRATTIRGTSAQPTQ